MAHSQDMNSKILSAAFTVSLITIVCTSAVCRAQTAAHQNLKKGVCLITGRQNADNWKSKVDALNVSWHYSWGESLPERQVNGVEFVPMIWGARRLGGKFDQTIEDLTIPAARKGSKALLGFNEPDGEKQANMTVAQAIEAWPHLMRTNRRLGSPGAVHADREWMQEFMKQAKERDLRVDFVCVHWYGPPNANNLLKRLEKVHQMYGKPIWITEFAVADWNAKSAAENRYSPEVVERFMRDILPKLDALDYVERYAWFTSKPDNRALAPSVLFTADGALTPLGRFYAEHATK